MSRSLLFAFLFLAATSSANAKPETWLEVRSQHFIVVSDAGERDAKQVADQFERMRAVFHTAAFRAHADPPAPIVVIAVKNEKDFRKLEPSKYLAKGMAHLGGSFLRAPDKNYVLLRLDAHDEQHPYAIVYHEYTHLLNSKAEDWLPSWLDEGFAEFYQNTDIRGKDIVVGEPSEVNILLLRQNKLLPLSLLFAVDHNSPYYQEENKGSIFYAESWALTHYFKIEDEKNGTHHIADYLQLVSHKVDPVTAAERAFGDLDMLQKTLEHYVAQPTFGAVKIKLPIEIDDSTFVVSPMQISQADAVRADFLAYNDRPADARALVDQVLKEAPNTAMAYETLGYLEFRAGHFDEARKACEDAITLNSQSFLANYYFGEISIRNGLPDAASKPAVEASFRRAIKLNPDFAPAYAGLAALFGMGRENLEEALMLSLKAVQMEPEDVGYRVTAGNILLEMRQIANAISVYKNALKLAKTPLENEQVQNALDQAEEYQDLAGRDNSSGAPASSIPEPDVATSPKNSAETPISMSDLHQHSLKGPRHEAKGIVKNVRCSPPAVLEFNLLDQDHTTLLHSDNYYKVDFTALGFTLQGELHPCTDIENLRARVQFVDSSVKQGPGQIVAVELSK